jgi:hypothetical protein
MTFNHIYSETDVTDESGVFEEPVSLDEMKDYLRLEGYVDSADSTSDDLSDFDFDDRLITETITASREKIESLTGSYLIPKTIEILFTNGSGNIELPGPNTIITQLLNNQGDEITSDNYKVTGNMWVKLKSPCYCDMVATMNVGYDDMPKSLKIEIMRYAAYLYENRGDNPVDPFSFKITGKYMKKNPIG